MKGSTPSLGRAVESPPFVHCVARHALRVLDRCGVTWREQKKKDVPPATRIRRTPPVIPKRPLAGRGGKGCAPHRVVSGGPRVVEPLSFGPIHGCCV